MIFKKLSLDESLFDKDFTWSDSASKDISGSDNYDDDFVSAELPQKDMQGPSSGSDFGISDLLITAMNDEWEAIRAYNSLVEALKYESASNPDYAAFISIINEINSEENKHVGQLQEILQRLSPNTSYIDKGREEGKAQFNFTNGKLQVQSWEPKQSVVNAVTSADEDMCTLADVDDEM